MPEVSFKVTAPAKINLYLHIVGQRENSFHLLDSLVAFASIHDVLKLTTAPKVSLEIGGPYADQLTAEPDNLVFQAARGLARICGIDNGAKLKLTKNLPVASGIGGGSSDAAATLKGLIRLWKVEPDSQALRELALELGTDVPVCLGGQAAFISGVGEQIFKAQPLPLCSLVLVNPGVAVSTPAVFKTREQSQCDYSKPGRFNYAPDSVRELVSILKLLHNDLDKAAQELCPEISQVLKALEKSQGSLLARMSGSGATCFALFADLGEARAASLNLARRFPHWWVQSGYLKDDINCPG